MNEDNTHNNVLNQELSSEKKTKGIHPADIKAMLEKKGISMSELSRVNGYHATAAGRALRTSWPDMEKIIAEAIGVPAPEIWPDRYDPNGNPLKYRPRKRG